MWYSHLLIQLLGKKEVLGLMQQISLLMQTWPKHCHIRMKSHSAMNWDSNLEIIMQPYTVVPTQPATFHGKLWERRHFNFVFIVQRTVIVTLLNKRDFWPVRMNHLLCPGAHPQRLCESDTRTCALNGGIVQGPSSQKHTEPLCPAEEKQRICTARLHQMSVNIHLRGSSSLASARSMLPTLGYGPLCLEGIPRTPYAFSLWFTYWVGATVGGEDHKAKAI